MKTIYNPLTDTLSRYPRSDDEPVVGLDSQLVVLDVIQEPEPTPGTGFSVRKADPVVDLDVGTVTYGWIVEALPELEPESDFDGFYAALLGSNVYQQTIVPALRSGASPQLISFMSVFRFAIEDALNGRIESNQPAKPNSLQSALWLLMESAQGILKTDDLQELQNLMDRFNLSATYVLVPPIP